MRFQNINPIGGKNIACMTYTDIAKIVNKSATYCQQVCQQQLKAKLNKNSKKTIMIRSKKREYDQNNQKPYELKSYHINHLTSPETLKRQIGMSLDERAADLTRHFPNKKISTTKLWYIYKKHRVRKKKIRITKIPNRHEMKRINRSIKEAKAELINYRQQGFRIIYLDETMVTKSTIPTHEWSNKNTNHQIDYKQFGQVTVAVLAGISREYGVDHIQQYDRSVNIPKFLEYIQNLRDKFFFDDIAIYMDNLAVHRSRAVKERLQELSIPYIYSPPYQPEFNPIESVFSMFKKELKVRRLKSILDNQSFEIKQNVKDVFDNIDIQKIAKCICHVQDLFKTQ